MDSKTKAARVGAANTICNTVTATVSSFVDGVRAAIPSADASTYSTSDMTSDVAVVQKRSRAEFEDAVVTITDPTPTTVEERTLQIKKALLEDVPSVGAGKHPKKKVRYNGNETVHVQTTEKSVATFMGLPAELRVMIYGHLFNTKSAKEVLTSNSGIHCCSCPEYPPPSPRSEVFWRNRANFGHAPGFFVNNHHFCTCSGTTQTAILQVSKQIHKEALPVFHDSIKVRVNMPFLGADGREDTLDRIEEEITLENRQHIKNIVLVDAGEETPYDEDETPEYWRRLAGLLPEVTHVRVHYDVDHEHIDADDLYNIFAGLVTLPKMTTIVLEVSECTYDDDDRDIAAAYGVKARKSLGAILRDEAKKSGKNLEITEA